MSLLGIAWRNIRQRTFTSGLTALSMALGVALVVATLVTGGIVKQAFESGAGLGYNMIVGAKGSPLQLVLNSVWSVLFFGMQNPGGALIEIVVLWLAIVATTVLFFRRSAIAGGLMTPYLLWVSFASFLNFTIWNLNRI